MELAINKQALFNYEVLETWEAGIILTGPEVKSVKQKKADLKGSYISWQNDKTWLIGAYIAPYKPAGGVQKNYEPKQARQLLLHKKENDKLRGQAGSPGLTVIPIKLYTSRGLVKIQIGLVRGKKQYDKKEKIKKRDLERDTKRTLKENY